MLEYPPQQIKKYTGDTYSSKKIYKKGRYKETKSLHTKSHTKIYHKRNKRRELRNQT